MDNESERSYLLKPRKTWLGGPSPALWQPRKRWGCAYLSGGGCGCAWRAGVHPPASHRHSHSREDDAAGAKIGPKGQAKCLRWNVVNPYGSGHVSGKRR